eukprot:5437502-Karenia_brevis.AAC.1
MQCAVANTGFDMYRLPLNLNVSTSIDEDEVSFHVRTACFRWLVEIGVPETSPWFSLVGMPESSLPKVPEVESMCHSFLDQLSRLSTQYIITCEDKDNNMAWICNTQQFMLRWCS